MAGNGQHHVADAPAQRRAPQDGRLAQGTGHGDLIAGRSGWFLQFQHIDGQHQLVAHAAAVVKGAQLPPDADRFPLVDLSRQKFRQQDRQNVRRAGETGRFKEESERRKYNGRNNDRP